MRPILLILALALALLAPGALAGHDGPNKEVCVREGPVDVTCVSEHEGSCDARHWHDTVSSTSTRLFYIAYVTAQRWCEGDRVVLHVQAPAVYVQYTDAADGSCVVTVVLAYSHVVREPCPVDQRAPDPGWGRLLP